MQVITDLHLHSKYSRAVSPQMILPVMGQWAEKKGLNIISAADFTHPLWFREIKSQLVEASEGLYKLKAISDKQEANKTLFILSTEISSIYKQGEKLRRIHSLVFMPNLAAVEKFREVLIKRGANLMADGRPIIGLSVHDLLEIVLNVDKKAFLIPCHAWTPHFGIYGTASGFDSLDEAFSDLSQYIYGIETGLSSDPEMNWEIKELENRSILSFSDAHSSPKMGREATVFVSHKNGISNDQFPISNKGITYEDIRLAIMRKSEKWKIGYTIEFYPEEGKYHYSGHRNCSVVFGPDDIRTKGNICPVCHRTLTEGVLFRVGQLADKELLGRAEEKANSNHIKWYTDKNKKHPPYVKLVPLIEIIAESLDSTVTSEKVLGKFDGMCKRFGSEMEILLKTPIAEISSLEGAKITEGIEKVRKGDIAINPGFDGVYGKVKIWKEDLEEDVSQQGKTKDAENQLGLGF